MLAVVVGLKVAVTPAGSPVAVSATLTTAPFALVTSIVLLSLAPPARSVNALTEEETLKPDAGMAKMIVVVLVRDPDVPLTITVYVPGRTEESGVNVSALLHGVLGYLKIAVTPLGSPETTKFTALLKPFESVMLTDVLALDPPTRRVSALAAEERVKPGTAGTASASEPHIKVRQLRVSNLKRLQSET